MVLYFSNAKLQKSRQTLWYSTSVILSSKKVGKLCGTVEPRFSVSKYSVNTRFSVIFLETKMNFVKQIE